MSGAPRVRSMNVADSETRPVFGRSMSTRKLASKPFLRRIEISPEEVSIEEEEKRVLPSTTVVDTSSPRFSSMSVPSILRRQESLRHSNFSLSASCSSDASSDSFQSRASTGRIYRTSNGNARGRRQLASKSRTVVADSVSESLPDGLQTKKRCAWVTPSTDPSYATFHDEEWGIPVHDDKKLFELLVLSGALAELTWPSILSKRHIFREVFADFDPITVAKFNEKKIVAPGSIASSLLSELKLRAIVENARQISKVIDEYGSFDKYIWSFVNYNPIVSRFRYPRQVPVKTPKADVISKDLVRRGFRSVGPTVIYSFMQVAGITNDHLVGCFRFQECLSIAESEDSELLKDKTDEKKAEEVMESQVHRAIEELSFSS